MNSHKIRESTQFWRDLYWYKHYQLDMKGTGKVQNGERSSNPQTSVGKLCSCKQSHFYRKNRMTSKVKLREQGGAKSQESSPWNSTKFRSCNWDIISPKPWLKFWIPNGTNKTCNIVAYGQWPIRFSLSFYVTKGAMCWKSLEIQEEWLWLI